MQKLVLLSLALSAFATRLLADGVWTVQSETVKMAYSEARLGLIILEVETVLENHQEKPYIRASTNYYYGRANDLYKLKVIDSMHVEGPSRLSDGWVKRSSQITIATPTRSKPNSTSTLVLDQEFDSFNEGANYRNGIITAPFVGGGETVFAQNDTIRDRTQKMLDDKKILLPELPTYRSVQAILKWPDRKDDAGKKTYLVFDVEQPGSNFETTQVFVHREGEEPDFLDVDINRLRRVGIFEADLGKLGRLNHKAATAIEVLYKGEQATLTRPDGTVEILERIPNAKADDKFLQKIGLPESRYRFPLLVNPCEVLHAGAKTSAG